MVKIVSFINLKGGVAKTTLSVNIAAALAKEFNKKVLIVDLDPQTNATVSVITQKEWEEKERQKSSLFYMFNDKIKGNHEFDIHKAIIKGVGDIKTLDLLPSSVNLIEIQDDIINISSARYVSPVEILQNALLEVKDLYDYIIIDCPPNLGTITLNGVNVSDYYIVPVVPDILSKYGLSMIFNRINAFKKSKKTCKIKCGGIVFTKVDPRYNLHKDIKKQIEGDANYYNSIFKTQLFPRAVISKATLESKPVITAQKIRKDSKYHDTCKDIINITKEFIERIK